MSKLTGTHSEAASYEFTTLTTVPGTMTVHGARIREFSEQFGRVTAKKRRNELKLTFSLPSSSYPFLLSQRCWIFVRSTILVHSIFTGSSYADPFFALEPTAGIIEGAKVRSLSASSNLDDANERELTSPVFLCTSFFSQDGKGRGRQVIAGSYKVTKPSLPLEVETDSSDFLFFFSSALPRLLLGHLVRFHQSLVHAMLVMQSLPWFQNRRLSSSRDA